MDKTIFTLIIALIGGFIGYELKIPAGTLIGSMAFVAVANILGFEPQMPDSFDVLAQMILGGFLGLTVTREVVIELKGYALPSLLVVAILAVFGIATGIIVSKFTGIDLYTALFGSVPGGMQEMIILSKSYDVNHSAVLVIQTVRRILIVVIYPFLVYIVTQYIKHFPDVR